MDAKIPSRKIPQKMREGFRSSNQERMLRWVVPSHIPQATNPIMAV